MSTLLVILLVLLIMGGFGYSWRYPDSGYGGPGLAVIVLIVLVVLLATGRL